MPDFSALVLSFCRLEHLFFSQYTTFVRIRQEQMFFFEKIFLGKETFSSFRRLKGKRGVVCALTREDLP